jgi:hypothetical protein
MSPRPEFTRDSNYIEPGSPPMAATAIRYSRIGTV